MRFSIIVPIYNTPIDLHKAMLESVKNQTYDDYEVILVNDGSTDTFLIEFDNLWVSKNPKFKLLHQENQGCPVARNTGIKAAVGDWVTFWDSDDFADKEYLESMSKMIDEQPNADLVFTGHFVCQKDTNTGRYVYKKIGDTPWIYDNCVTVETEPRILGLYSGPWARAIKREVVINNNVFFPNKRVPLDDLYYLVICLSRVKTWFIQEKHYLYYQVSIQGSLTHSGNKYKNLWSTFYAVKEAIIDVENDDSFVGKNRKQCFGIFCINRIKFFLREYFAKLQRHEINEDPEITKLIREIEEFNNTL